MRRAAILAATFFAMLLVTQSSRADGYYSPYGGYGYGCSNCWNHPFGSFGYGYGYGHGHGKHKYKDRADEYRGVLPIPPYGAWINPNRSPRDFWMLR